MRCRVPVEVTLPSHRIRKVSERTLTRAATCLKISVVKPGTFNRQAVLGKNPPDVRYDIIAWASSRLMPPQRAFPQTSNRPGNCQVHIVMWQRNHEARRPPRRLAIPYTGAATPRRETAQWRSRAHQPPPTLGCWYLAPWKTSESKNSSKGIGRQKRPIRNRSGGAKKGTRPFKHGTTVSGKPLWAGRNAKRNSFEMRASALRVISRRHTHPWRGFV